MSSVVVCLGLTGALLTLRGLLLLGRSRTCKLAEFVCVSSAGVDGYLAFWVVVWRSADVRLGRTGLGLAGLALRPRDWTARVSATFLPVLPERKTEYKANYILMVFSNSASIHYPHLVIGSHLFSFNWMNQNQIKVRTCFFLTQENWRISECTRADFRLWNSSSCSTEGCHADGIEDTAAASNTPFLYLRFV